jgi:hypothetical protein
MTIRQHVRRRFGYGLTVGFAAWVLLAILMFSTGKATGQPIIFVCIFVFVAAAVFIQFAIRCLLCGGNLGLLLPGMFTFFGRKRRINFCPYCGTSLDERFDGNKQAAARERAMKRAA